MEPVNLESDGEDEDEEDNISTASETEDFQEASEEEKTFLLPVFPNLLLKMVQCGAASLLLQDALVHNRKGKWKSTIYAADKPEVVRLQFPTDADIDVLKLILGKKLEQIKNSEGPKSYP
ncbi:hypothetical protein QE152_g8382 [Popillia japonica]|uniref:Uncharacterized protein n=1 Tax=Popillia japonica TaxID=7064 RepID=A0AAW1MBD4_POPJA